MLPRCDIPLIKVVAGTGKGVTKRQLLFASRVREQRTAAGMSQEQLSFMSGINRTYIGSLESGRRNPSLENICRLAVALGIDAADLVRGAQELKGR